MAEIPGFVGFAVDDGVGTSFVKRQAGCVLCPDGAPDCPTCAKDESCVTLSQSCTQCPQSVCMKDPAKLPSQGDSGPNVGAIAGGVIGGLVFVAALTYFVWRFCIKNKRASYAGQFQAQGQAAEGERTKEQIGNDDASRQSQRESTHTVHSIASTVLTRASNIIQIAYIPGVTNRATPNSPTLLVPTVPPIPAAYSGSASSSPYEDQHFFVPGNLRDSTYSGISSYTDRMSYARTSFAPRSSIASATYPKNAIVSPVSAQRGNFVKPSIVSVKSRTPSTNGDDPAPPVPTFNFERYDKPLDSSTFSIRDGNASTATPVKPQVVRVGGGLRAVDVKAPSKLSTTMTLAEPDRPPSPVELPAPTPVELPADSIVKGKEPEPVTTKSDDDNTPAGDLSPFADPPSTNDASKRKSALSIVVEDSAGRESPINQSQSSSASTRKNSPFGDENAVRE
ncbi:hypothetical protein GGR50DRAFT_697368 [Xylaria sp. CBS 124048]|nr:hypothetical protein GGR50DRAFT_697368 [Xylaria sp. CBS 124048]